jgi:predicted transcriptional regulator
MHHGDTIVLNIAASLVGSLEFAIMECFWANGPQTGRDILTTLRKKRTIAHSTVTTTLARLYDQGLLTREPIRASGRRQSWRYTARYTSRSALLAGTFEQLAAQIGADYHERVAALGMLLGVVRVT